MAAQDLLVERIRYHVRDHVTKDSDLLIIIQQVLEDIAFKTHIFKKVFGFTVHADKELYDFKAIARMDEQVEFELSKVTIGEVSKEALIQALITREFPSPEVIKETYQDEIYVHIINVLEIFNNRGQSISDKFDNHGSFVYHCNDQQWLIENDAMQCAYVASILPALDELREDDIKVIIPTLIAGVKYYVNDSMQSPDDAQVANLFYQRYYAMMNELTNIYPTAFLAIKPATVTRKFP